MATPAEIDEARLEWKLANNRLAQEMAAFHAFNVEAPLTFKKMVADGAGRNAAQAEIDRLRADCDERFAAALADRDLKERRYAEAQGLPWPYVVAP